MANTLWIQVTCLSPMPSMRCAPKPTSKRVGHWTGSTATVREDGKRFLMASPAAMVPAEPMADTKAPISRPEASTTSIAAAAVQWKWNR